MQQHPWTRKMTISPRVRVALQTPLQVSCVHLQNFFVSRALFQRKGTGDNEKMYRTRTAIPTAMAIATPESTTVIQCHPNLSQRAAMAMAMAMANRSTTFLTQHRPLSQPYGSVLLLVEGQGTKRKGILQSTRANALHTSTHSSLKT